MAHTSVEDPCRHIDQPHPRCREVQMSPEMILAIDANLAEMVAEMSRVQKAEREQEQ